MTSGTIKNLRYLPVLALALWACTPVERPVSGDLELGRAFHGATQTAPGSPAGEQSASSEDGWWMLYESRELNALMRQAFEENPGLNQTRARLAQAAAASRKSASFFWPQATLTGKRETSSGDNSTPSDFTLAGAAGYELDLWGKNRAAFKADSLTAQAGMETLHAAGITLSAAITESWLRLLAAREEEALLREQIDINATILDLQIKRFSMGSAAALDVLQQKETLARSRGQLPEILARQDELKHDIAILTGRSPAAFRPQIVATKLPDPLPLPDAGLPSGLLAARPDIAAAWLNVRAADWAAQAAAADRLPDFTLSATYTTSAAMLDSLFNAWLLKLAAEIAAPVLDGGNRRAEVWRREAVADERYHAYRETVLKAVAEVENALSRNRHQEEELHALAAQSKAARDTFRQAQISYAKGDQDYIAVLNSLNSVQQLERQTVEERLALHLYRVALYRALGGQRPDIQREAT